MADLKGDELVFDLYTGTGTIAQYLAHRCRTVVGVEGVPAAIEDARKNAALNGISNATFLTGDMKNVFNADFLREYGQPDLIVTDPPREGMHPDVVAMLLQVGAPTVLYISCNPATQARDLALMKDHYDLVAIQPVDMFPHTHHVENIALLRKR
jgi:23S rRNA (uracil1939-C5)-methyltransferase